MYCYQSFVLVDYEIYNMYKKETYNLFFDPTILIHNSSNRLTLMSMANHGRQQLVMHYIQIKQAIDVQLTDMRG